MEFKSNSVLKTEEIAKNLASSFKGNEIIALYGDLGVGKTAFTRGIADYFGIKDEVSSPTFSIVNEYCGKFKIYHFDMYRITNFEELESTGFFDYIGNGIIIIEWSENIESELPKDLIKVRISKIENDSRLITIERSDNN